MTHGPSVRRLLAILLGTFGALVGGADPRHVAAAAELGPPGRRREPPGRVVPPRRQHAPELERPHPDGPALRRRPAQPRYREYYEEILAIRAGTRPGPSATTARSGTGCSPRATASSSTARRSRWSTRCGRPTSTPASSTRSNASLDASNDLARARARRDGSRRRSHRPGGRRRPTPPTSPPSTGASSTTPTWPRRA